MLSKNNRKLQERKLQEKQRFGFRKYSFGLASALLGVSFMLGTGSTVSAATTTTSAETVETATTTNTDSGTGTEDTSSSKVAGAAAVSTTDTPATETKNVAVGPEASNTGSDSSEITDANRTSAKNDKTASHDSKTETIDDSAKKSIDSASSPQNNTSTANAQTDKQDSAAPADTQNVAAAQTETAEAASATEKMTVNTAASGSVPSNQLAQSKAAVRKNAIMLAASTTTVNDNAAKAEGKITDEGTAKGLEKSDVAPGMSDANGARLVADNSNIPSGYKADPTEGRYTVGIVSLGGDFDKWVKGDSSKFKSYNGENNTHYYLRFSTSKNATNGTYDSTVYSQVVDATTDTVKWEQALTPNSGAVKVNNGTDGFELSSKVAGVTQYYELKYTDTKIGNASTSRIAIIPNNGSLTAVTVYSNGKAIPAGSATPGTYTSVLFPATGVIKTEYIAQDAAKKETTLATYEEEGRQGYKYTISGPRAIKGYDLISSPSTTTGILGKTYNVGDVYVGGNLELSDQLQLARVYVATSEYGDAKVEVRVALKKDADGNAITINSVNDSNIWKTIFSTDSLAPGATASDGNYGDDGASYYINGKDGKKYITDAGFTEEQLAGYNKHLAVIILANGLTQGQEPAKYYYAPQGQVRINYVTSDGTVIQGPVSAYVNSGANTSYDVTDSKYQPQTITVNDKTYRYDHYVESDKSKETPGTTEVNGYTYNVIPSNPTGTIKSTTVNDVYYVYEQVKYHTEAEPKDVTRTIQYYDSVTGEQIPADLEKTVTQTATLKRNKIYDDQNHFIGYGTVSEDGSSYTLDDSWKVADQTWTKQDSADLSDYGYTAPDKATVEAETVDGSTTDTTVTVYYGHQTVPVTPEKPGTPGKPINPKGNVKYPDGVSKADLTSAVTRTINYVDEDGKAVNGSPDGTSSYVQKAEFTRTAIVDKVTGKILGYDTDNDGKVDTESKDRAWTPTEKTLEAVKSADPSSVGYDKVDKSTVESLLVTPGQADTTVTVTYSNKQVSGTIKYIDVTTGVELDSDTLPTGKVGSKINYKTKDKIKSYESQGYELVSNDFTDGSQVYEKEGNNFVVKLKHKTQTITPNDPNPVTPGEPINPDDPNSPVYGEETDRKNLVKDASQTIHYVGAGDNTPADNVVTQKDAFTRTVTIDKVTGKVLSYTDWTGEKTFNTVGTPVVEGYHADKKVAGGLTATVDNPDVEETVTYAPNGKLVPVDPKGTPIPGADTPTYKNDPDDPSKVVPNEPTPDVPGYKTDVPNVTPEDPTKDTPVPYTQDGKGETPSTPEVPTTPSNPEVPTSPEEPSTPDTPEVPSQPQEPASPSGQKPSQPQEPASPSGQKPSQPAKPASLSGQKPSQPAKPATPKQTTFTPNSGKKTPAQGKTATASQLPQTGADEEKAILLSAFGLGLVTLTSLFGLLGGKKRKH